MESQLQPRTLGVEATRLGEDRGDQVFHRLLREAPHYDVTVQSSPDLNALLEKTLSGQLDLATCALDDLLHIGGIPEPLSLVATLPRLSVEAVLLGADSIAALKDAESVFASGSFRRAQLQTACPDISFCQESRGVDEFLSRMDGGEPVAAVMARCDLAALGEAHRGGVLLDPSSLFPSTGQGIIAVLARTDEEILCRVAGSMNHEMTSRVALAEIGAASALSDGSEAGVYGVQRGEVLHLQAKWRNADGAWREAACQTPATSIQEPSEWGLCAIQDRIEG